jgi:hypothetical protein
MASECRLGVDFDNTLICYDHVLYDRAVARGLVSPDTPKNKTAIRAAIRCTSGGELSWQKLQAEVYGERIDDAQIPSGVKAFFEVCRQQRIRVSIISHKSEFAAQDRDGVSLRWAAMSWMRARKFFEDGFGLAEDDVYFEPTAGKKLARIERVGCTHFIDDLKETFQHQAFPQAVHKLLYAPQGESSEIPGLRVFGTWKEISDYLVSSRD